MNSIVCYDYAGALLKNLYQWDSNQKILISGVDAGVAAEIHFCHPDSVEALVLVPHIEREYIVATIPNILLQQAKPIVVYVFQDSANSGSRTISSLRIPVYPRPKPIDYVYTETEVLCYREIDERLKALEQGGVVGSVHIDDTPPENTSTLWVDISDNSSDSSQDADIADNIFIGTAETSHAEFLEAFNAGKACFLIPERDNNAPVMYAVSCVTNNLAHMSRTASSGLMEYGYIDSSGNIQLETKSYSKAVDEKSTDDQIPTAKAVYDFGLSVSGGLSDSAKKLLITILRNAVYSTDQSANITALENALAGGEEEPDEPDVPDVPVVTTYTISKELVNVTSNNAATSVNENASYTATLTADEGYEISKVTVTMGGVDVTADVYADGVISIPAVTGNVEIIASAVVIEEPSAELVTEGLLTYFDFRTAEYNNSGAGGSTTISPTQGEGQLFTWANNVVTGQDNRGIHTNGRAFMYSQAGNTVQNDIGTPMTIVMLAHGHVMSQGFNYINMSPGWAFRPSYKTSADTMVLAEQRYSSLNNADSIADYNFCVYRVDGNILTEIMDTSVTTYDGSEIDGFASWQTTVGANVINGSDDDKYMVALVVYNRALSDVEIEEVRAFMKTLEVA